MLFIEKLNKINKTSLWKYKTFSKEKKNLFILVGGFLYDFFSSGLAVTLTDYAWPLENFSSSGYLSDSHLC